MQRPAQLRAFDQLHHNRAVFNAIDRGDVRMVQRRQRMRLARKPGQRFRVLPARQYLDRHVPVQLRIRRPIDRAHAALAQLAGDFVVGDLLRGHNSSMLPEGGDGILPDGLIASEQRHLLHPRLRDQQAVKRIFVQQRQMNELETMLCAY